MNRWSLLDECAITRHHYHHNKVIQQSTILLLSTKLAQRRGRVGSLEIISKHSIQDVETDIF